MHKRSVALAAALFAISSTALAAPADPHDPLLPRLKKILKATPLIDGHNDWPGALAGEDKDARWTMDLNRLDTGKYDTDIERLKQGLVGGQFWSVYVSANLPPLEQIKKTLEQIDLVKSVVARYPNDFQLVRTAAEIRAAHKAGKIASLMGAEGGGQIDESFSVLRAYHELGVGYLTLTHSKTISWADSATDAPQHDGLTRFGVEVIREMNRLGMLVDLSHVSEATMLDAIAASKAPIIFSHSSARVPADHPRNVSDVVLRKVAQNKGVVMVNFAPGFISEPLRQWNAQQAAESARNASLYLGQPDRAKAANEAWLRANPQPKATLDTVVEHVEHVVKVAGHDYVGLGGDYDGLPFLPEGMEGVEAYPPLLLALMRKGWSDENIVKLAGGNILRVMDAAEKVAVSMKNDPPATATIKALDGVQ